MLRHHVWMWCCFFSRYEKNQETGEAAKVCVKAHKCDHGYVVLNMFRLNMIVAELGCLDCVSLCWHVRV